MNHGHKKAGFTLIELMLSMAFISVLLLAVAMTVIQMGQTYNRGMILKEVNQVARAIADDVHRTVASSRPIDMSANYLTTNTSGRFCTGQASYIWNTELQVEQRDRDYIGFENSDDPVRFIKIPDLGGNYCVRQSDGTLVFKDIREEDRNKVVDLLRTNDYTIVLHDFEAILSSSSEGSSTGQQLFVVLVTIGTGELSALNDTQTACLAPGQPGASVNSCFVQQFTIAARTGNKVN